MILFVIENFVSVDMPVNREMGISQRFFHRAREWRPALPANFAALA